MICTSYQRSGTCLPGTLLADQILFVEERCDSVCNGTPPKGEFFKEEFHIRGNKNESFFFIEFIYKLCVCRFICMNSFYSFKFILKLLLKWWEWAFGCCLYWYNLRSYYWKSQQLLNLYRLISLPIKNLCTYMGWRSAKVFGCLGQLF